uniref:Uncharacterized protein n=1 Tax=Caenorhabditis japonica TaxID=281687 RepID=A0A8R1HRF8_CAEJA
MSLKYILIAELTLPATILVPDITLLYTAQDRRRQPPYTFLINSAHHVAFLPSVLRTSLLLRMDSHSNLTNNLSGTQNNFPHTMPGIEKILYGPGPPEAPSMPFPYQLSTPRGLSFLSPTDFSAAQNGFSFESY